MKLSVVFAMLILLVAGNVHASDRKRSHAPMISFADMSQLGTSTLTRRHGKVGVHVDTQLATGDGYTLWVVVFNYPEHCASAPCSSADMPFGSGDPRVQASLLYLTGHFAGAGIFQAELLKSPSGLIGRELLWGPGLLKPRSAEIHLVVRNHGPAIPSLTMAQITSFSGGCEEPPAEGEAGPRCTNTQFAVHVAD